MTNPVNSPPTFSNDPLVNMDFLLDQKKCIIDTLQSISAVAKRLGPLPLEERSLHKPEISLTLTKLGNLLTTYENTMELYLKNTGDQEGKSKFEDSMQMILLAAKINLLHLGSLELL